MPRTLTVTGETLPLHTPFRISRGVKTAAEVVTVEVDPAMVAFARSELCGFENIRFVEADALDGKGRLAPELERAAASIEPFLWISNLPYGLAA